MNPLRGSVIALAGLVGAGVLAWPSVGPSVAAPADDYLKRDEQDVDLVLVDEDPDDDPDDDPNDPTSTRATRTTKNTRDTTRATQVTRDRDMTNDASNDRTDDAKDDETS